MKIDQQNLWVFGLWIAVLILDFFLGFRQQKRLRQFASPALLPVVNPFFNRTRMVWGRFFFYCGLLFICLSLLRPQWGDAVMTKSSRGHDLYVAIDVSLSMNAEDVSPSRLARSKQEIRAILDRLTGDRVGLIVFAGDAYVQLPLTSDMDAVGSFLSEIDSSMISVPGTNLQRMLEVALSGFRNGGGAVDSVIVFSDGEAFDGQTKPAIEALKQFGIRVFTVAVGSPDGGLIPIRDPGTGAVRYKNDQENRPVLTKPNAAALGEIAVQSGGRNFVLTNQSSVADALVRTISTLPSRAVGATQYESTNQYQWFLCLGLLCLLIAAAIPCGRGVSK